MKYEFQNDLFLFQSEQQEEHQYFSNSGIISMNSNTLSCQHHSFTHIQEICQKIILNRRARWSSLKPLRFTRNQWRIVYDLWIQQDKLKVGNVIHSILTNFQKQKLYFLTKSLEVKDILWKYFEWVIIIETILSKTSHLSSYNEQRDTDIQKQALKTCDSLFDAKTEFGRF